MKVVFFGTGDIVLPTLKYLLDNHEVVAVYTKPAVMVRKKLKYNPIYNLLSKDIIHTPDTLKSEIDYIKSLNADIGIVYSYGLIIPQKILNLFLYGCINIHPSFLPKWRGCAPIQRAIEAGDREYGLSIMKMDCGIDTGALYSQIMVYKGYPPKATFLYDLYAKQGAQEIEKFFKEYINNIPIPQKLENISYAKKIEKNELLLDISKSAEELVFKINAFVPLYTPYIEILGIKVKVFSARIYGNFNDLQIGEIALKDNRKTLIIKCNNSCLSLLEVQPENGKRMKIKDFINGYLKNF